MPLTQRKLEKDDYALANLKAVNSKYITLVSIGG